MIVFTFGCKMDRNSVQNLCLGRVPLLSLDLISYQLKHTLFMQIAALTGEMLISEGRKKRLQMHELVSGKSRSAERNTQLPHVSCLHVLHRAEPV